MNNWHTQTLGQALDSLRSGADGLSSDEAKSRLAEYGANVLPEAKSESIIVTFLHQFQSPLIYLLLAAAAAVLFIGETADAAIIFAVLLFNAIVGTVQEGRAQNSLRALRHLVHTSATVLRDGSEAILPDSELVPGDILILDEGARVPADARVIQSRGLKVDESSLTGESLPVHKTEHPARHENTPIAERHGMVFMGTNVVAGTGRAVVVSTGSATEIGGIAEKIATIDTEVPLKADIRHLSRIIIVIVAFVSAIIFMLGLWEGAGFRQMFATIVSLAVSVVPAGLPIVITIVLATGVARMSKRNVLVKKLQAVEALGQARIIAVDKTGTITRNELAVQRVWTGGAYFDVGGSGYEPKGLISHDGVAVDAANSPDVLLCGKIAALCSNARPVRSEESGKWRVAGDPTEAAMFVFGQKAGFHRDTIEGSEPLVAELPFDYVLRYHAVMHGTDAHRTLYVAGAPEGILERSTHIMREGKRHELHKEDREELERVFTHMSEKGLRVVAGALHDGAAHTLQPDTVHSLTFAGFLGLQDTLRAEVHDAEKRAEDAGIKVVMITGDHMITARAVAKDAGIFEDGDRVLSGKEIDGLTDEGLAAALHDVSVFARVTPEHKLRIITAYKKRGQIIAMTGDGVNDAPSLVAADLGVAMGITGTEVAKEAADLVLLDDNFGSIVAAVEEGRSIYKTVQKVILYLFSTSAGEVLAITGSLLLGLPLLLLPVQIIWLNFVTDGFLDVSLAMEPKEKGLLSSVFKRPRKYLVNSLMVTRMMLMAATMAAGALGLYAAYYVAIDPAKAGTVALTVLAVFQWLNAWNCRSESASIFRMNPLSNKYLLGATAIVVFLQILTVYLPPLQNLLHTTALAAGDWGVIVLVATSIVWVEEIRKALYRLRTSA
ncbi:MAG: cation-transporting P-type ATPase [Patescibacteria group bacterium]|nr:cation-transporting P-type ATPase [Patescibacteria group bacterium]